MDVWVHRANVCCSQRVLKSSIKQIPFVSSLKMSFFPLLLPVSKPSLQNRALIFSIPNSRAAEITEVRYQITRDWRRLVAASSAPTLNTQATIFIRPSFLPPKSNVKGMQGKLPFLLSLPSERQCPQRKVSPVWGMGRGRAANTRVFKSTSHP